MTPGSNSLPFQQALLQQIEESLLSFPLGMRLRDAFYATPRHCFIHRYRSPQATVWRERKGSDQKTEYRHIYQDNPLVLVDGDGMWSVPSTNSQPSFVIQLAHHLDVRPGANVLEIGSGSGWLAGILGRLAEPSGQVTGLEVIPELAKQSAEDIASLNIPNVNIFCCDGSAGYAVNAPYDRIVFTAAIFDLPGAFHDQIKPGGILIVPVRMAVGRGETIYVLRRTRSGFESIAAFDGFFVSMKGAPNALAVKRFSSYEALTQGSSLEDERLWWWGTAKENEFSYMSAAFRTFLTLTRAETVRAFEVGSAFAFGLEIEQSFCIATQGLLRTFGTSHAREAFVQSVFEWCQSGMPSGAAWSLIIERSGREVPRSGFKQRRGDSVFTWTLNA